MSTAVEPASDGPLPLRASAIVCTRNRSQWSRRAVASLLAQDLPAECFEIVVVDNASTDDTAAVLTELIAGHPNARYVREPNLGLSRARNRGIAETTGGVIAFLDDDAEALPGWARHHLARYRSDEGVVATAGRIDLGWPTGRPDWLPRRWEGMYAGLDLGDVAHDLAPPAIPYGANMAFRRSALGDGAGFAVGLGRRGDDLTSGEERELFERLRARGGRIVYVPEARATHYVMPGREDRRWFLRRVWAQGRTRVLLISVIGPRRSRMGWAVRVCYETVRTLRELLRWAVRSAVRRPAADRMDSLARSLQTAAIAKESLRMALVRNGQQ